MSSRRMLFSNWWRSSHEAEKGTSKASVIGCQIFLQGAMRFQAQACKLDCQVLANEQMEGDDQLSS